ncbi:MAG: hypothetical protein D4R95_04215 [Actinobacteria bacterium]|nr:MAG: hypothetical protein D4R95_04215 [Actinomycetota bacterium]
MNTVRRPTGWLSQLSLTDDNGETVGGMIDHRLTRRALINEFRRGRMRREQLCDAHPDLVRAAKNFGDATSVKCPICVQDNVVLVTYVFGPRLPSHGRCITKPNELEEFRQLAQLTEQQRVGADQSSPITYTAYVVECCRSCRWHHLLRSLPMATAPNEGAGSTRRRSRR